MKKEHKEKHEHEEESQNHAQPQQEDCENKEQQYYEQLIRLQADFENYRKRTEREKAELIAFGASQTVMQFLPVYDAMLKAQEQLKKNSDSDPKALKEGLNMILKALTKVFETAGVKPMETLGKPYDPMEQEVLTTLACTPEQDNHVIEEVQKGFTLNGKILRCAKVVVGKNESAAEADSKEETEAEEA